MRRVFCTRGKKNRNLSYKDYIIRHQDGDGEDDDEERMNHTTKSTKFQVSKD